MDQSLAHYTLLASRRNESVTNVGPSGRWESSPESPYRHVGVSRRERCLSGLGPERHLICRMSVPMHLLVILFVADVLGGEPAQGPEPLCITLWKRIFGSM